MAVPIIENWETYFLGDGNEGLGSSYERVIINNKLLEICDKYNVKSVFETPTFGFTGLSGINSAFLAKKGFDISLVEKNQNRLKKIKNIWSQFNLEADFYEVEKYESLPFCDKSKDMCWNFSAMWFVEDIDLFFKELDRITKKIILICVPNRSGMGYLSQKYSDLKKFHNLVNEEYILPSVIIKKMKLLGWNLLDSDYIDCPPWPDIGMAKEEFLSKIGLKFLVSAKKDEDIPYYSILDYYKGVDDGFPDRVLKHFWFEKAAPKFIKKFWAHHRYFLFSK